MIKQLVYREDFLLEHPEEHWETIINHMSAGAMADDGPLLKAGIMDKEGRYIGDPEFGLPLDLMKGSRRAFHGSAVDHEWHHGAKDSPIVENLGMPTPEEGRRIWGGDYKVLPNGSHGPSKRSIARRQDKVRYLRASGHVEMGDFCS